MLSLFKTEPSADIPAGGPVNNGIHFEDAAPEEAAEFEIVLGRRQLASVGFVATVIVAVITSFGYMAGKAIGPAPKTVIQRVVETVPAPSAPSVQAPSKPETPLFANPVDGALYIQMGAVEKGIAVIFAEGLRKHGLDAFVAPGPNDHIFRVLIGPVNGQEAHQKARKTVDDLGLTTFARKFPE